MNSELVTRRLVISSLLILPPIAARAQTSSKNSIGDLLGRIPGLSKGTAPVSGVKGVNLPQSQIGLGLKDALKVAANRVIGRVGKIDGFYGDPDIRIPLPGPLQEIEVPLKAIGASGMLDDLRIKMNRAAEQAAPKALDIFVGAATKMTFDDARVILTGPQDAATQYFRRTTSDSLTQSFRPIVNSALSGVGAVVALNAVKTRANAIPFIGQSVADFDLTGFTVGKVLDGLFHYLAVEEAAIRTNPVARTTNLLKQVFG